jgi:hypothetical protein
MMSNNTRSWNKFLLLSWTLIIVVHTTGALSKTSFAFSVNDVEKNKIVRNVEY